MSQYKKFVSKEYEAIKSGLDIVKNPDLTLKDLKIEYRKLLKTYNKTNKRLSRIVEHSDRQQRQIQELNEKLKELSTK